MSESPEQVSVEEAELVSPPDGGDSDDGKPQEFIEQPAKVMRVGAMLRQLLDELRETHLDEGSRERLREIYEISVRELGGALSDDLREELGRLALPFDEHETPSESELRVAKAQLVGWLEGLIQGIQATLFAQQMAAQQQLANMRGQLGRGEGGAAPQGAPPQGPQPGERTGTYL